MQSHAQSDGSSPLAPTLRCGDDPITCQLDARDNHSYELCVVPPWDPSSSVIECFETPTTAVLRRAEIARRLREHGWMVIDHVERRAVRAAA